MLVRHVVVGAFQENSYVAVCEETGEAILVDPGAEPEKIVALVASLGAKPVRILNTHGHLDHIGAVEDLRRRYGIPWGIHEGERENVESLALHCRMFGLTPPPQPTVDHGVADGEEFRFGKEALTAILTPGHTAGGVSYHAPGRVFVGDTLFLGSVGRTDLPGGDFATLHRSIRERLFTLPPETVVHSGHGPDTTIAREKATNPFVGDHADPRALGFL